MSETSTARPSSHEAIVRDGMYEPIRPGDDRPAKPTILDQTHGAANRILTDLRKAIPSSFGTSRTVANDALGAASRAISEAGSAIVKANSDARAVAGNREIYPDGRKDRINAIVAEAGEKVGRAIETISGSVELMQASLAQQALPAPPSSKADSVALQSQALSLLDRTTGEKRQDLFTRLAVRGDEISGLLLSPYGKDLAEVLFGERLGSAIWKGAHARALANAAANGNVHALAVSQAAKLHGIAAGLRSAWGNSATELRRLKLS